MGRAPKGKVNTEILAGKHYQKSNTLINAKGTTSIFTQKIFAIGIQRAEMDEKTGILSSTLYPSDLKKLLGKEGNSIYTQLKNIVHGSKKDPSLLDWRVIYTDDTSERMEAINVITDCSFEDGILTIRYNNRINSQIYQLKENYTIFSLEDTLPLKSQYSFRLYEILKSEYDKQYARMKKTTPHIREGQRFISEVDLTELRLKLGIIDSSADKEIINALKRDNPDYEKIEELASNGGKKKYSIFSNFRVNVLDKAKAEISEKTHFEFDYEGITSGRGGKTVAIRFFIWKKTQAKPEVIDQKTLTEEDKENILDEIISLFEERLKLKDYKAIANAADYDIELIRRQYEAMKLKKTQVDDIVGYMIAAVKNNYSAPIKKVRKSSFNDFDQNTYDFDELESQIVEN